jgi:hypothetical protein
MMITLAKPSIAESSPKPHQRDRARRDAREQRDRALDRHPHEREPREKPGAAREALERRAVGSGRRIRRAHDDRQLERAQDEHGTRGAPETAAQHG